MYTNSLFYGISKIKARKHKWVTLLSLIKCAETKAMACTYDKQIFCSYLKLWVQILSILKEERCSCTHCTSLISNRALSNPIIHSIPSYKKRWEILTSCVSYFPAVFIRTLFLKFSPNSNSRFLFFPLFSMIVCIFSCMT